MGNKIRVRCYTDTGGIGNGYISRLRFDLPLNIKRFRQQIIAKSVVGCIKFQQRFPRVQPPWQGQHCRQKLQVCGDGDCRAPDMIYHRREMRMAQCDNTQILADTTNRANFRLGDIKTTIFKNLPPAPAVEFRFSA